MGFLEDRLKQVGEGFENVGSSWTLKSTIMVIVLTAIFIGVGYYVYITYIQPTMKPTYVANNEFQTDETAADADDEASAGTKQIGNKRAEFYLFYTDWCPYSKKVLPIWDKIQARFNGEVNESGYVLDYIKINGESQANELEKFQANYLKEAAKDKIDGYPSIYMVKDEQVVEFEAQPTEETLIEFINTMF